MVAGSVSIGDQRNNQRKIIFEVQILVLEQFIIMEEENGL
jgi:hypothetical protein